MGLQRVTAATAKPISRQEVKSHLNLQGTTQDDCLIDDLIDSAVDYVERVVSGGKALSTQTWDWVLPEFPGDSFELPKPPLSSVTHIKYFDADNTQQTLSSTASDFYVVTGTYAPGSVSAPSTAPWPSVYDRPDSVTIRFVCGTTGEAEPTLRQAIRMLVAHWYEHRESEVLGTISTEVKMGLERLLVANNPGVYF